MAIIMMIRILSVVAKVGYAMPRYVFVEGETSPVCVSHEGTLKRPISVSYSLISEYDGESMVASIQIA